MTDKSRIAELASVIESRTLELDNHFKDHNLPSPSFSVDAAPDLLLPDSLLVSQNEILEATAELQALIAGPLAHLTRLTSPTINILTSLQAIYRYKIAFCFGVDEEISFEEIAKRCSLDESDARRLLRMATANHIFHEPRKGVIVHTAISKLLVQVPYVHEWVGLVCDEMWPTGTRTIDAMMKWPGSQEPQHTAFSLNSGTGQSMWDMLRQDPKRSQRFADGMMFLQSAPVFNVNHLFNDLEWEAEGCPRLVVDVGGSRGSISIGLLRRFPALKCVVEDLPEMISGALIPSDLEARLEFKAHDFFTEQPVKNADVYFMRSILHDWSDPYAIRILRNLIPALKPGAKVVINEVCLPEPNTLPAYQEQLLRGYDLAMKHEFNSKERDADDWVELLRASDARFKLKKIKCSPGSILSVIEAIWEDEPPTSTTSTEEALSTSRTLG